MWNLLGPGMPPCPLLWYVDFYPLCHQGSPSFDFLNPVISEPAAHSWFQVCVCVCVCVCACTHSVVSDSLQSPELSSARLLCLWNFPGKNTGVGRHFLLQGIFPTKRWTPRCLRLLHYRQILDPLSR